MTAMMWKVLVREYGMKVYMWHNVHSLHGAGSQKKKKSVQWLSRGSAAESAVCVEEELTMKVPTGAKGLVDVHGMDVFSNGHGDLVLGYGLASNLVWTSSGKTPLFFFVLQEPGTLTVPNCLKFGMMKCTVYAMP